jgi:hypothetical protein
MNTMHKFELYTEAKGQLVELAREIFPSGFTINDDLLGYWKGNRELSVCIVVVAEGGPDAELARASIRELAKRINTLNNQQATLIFESVGWGEMVTERF